MKQIIFLATVTILLLACKEGTTPVSVPDIDRLLPPPPTQETVKVKSVDEKILPVAEDEKSTFEPVDISTCVKMLERKGFITKSDYEYQEKGIGGSNTVRYSDYLRQHLKLFSYDYSFLPDRPVAEHDQSGIEFTLGREIGSLSQCILTNAPLPKGNYHLQFEVSVGSKEKIHLTKNTNIPKSCLKEYIGKVSFPVGWLEKNKNYAGIKITVNIQKEYEYTFPFLIAMEKNEADALRCIVDKSRNRKDVLNEMLVLAAEKGDTETLKILLVAGANVNEPSRRWMEHNRPLFFAALNNQKEAVRLLLEKGADINSINYLGMTVLSILDDICSRGYEKESPTCPHEEMIKYLKANGAQKEKLYFPETDLRPFTNRWFSGALKSMNEQPLFNRVMGKGEERYRLLWLRSFHPPVMLSIEKKEHSYSLCLKVLSGKGGYASEKLVTDKEIILAPQDGQEFMTLLTKAKFWELPTTDDSIVGADGAEWILEARTADKYHMVERWSAIRHGPKEFADACLFLLKLTGDTFEPIY